MTAVARAITGIRRLVSGSPVPEDPSHAENTLAWVLALRPDADAGLRIAALGHDIDRAVRARRIRKDGFPTFDQFKAAHASNSAVIIEEILADCGVEASLIQDVTRLVKLHETGGDERADLINTADSISFFHNNLPYYVERHGYPAAMTRSLWGMRRLAPRYRRLIAALRFEDPGLGELARVAAEQADREHVLSVD